MKVFFSTNQASLHNIEFGRLLRVAVGSCRRNTTMDPFLLIDGKPDLSPPWLERLECSVLYCESTLTDIVYEWVSEHVDADRAMVRTGAFTRYEIPRVLRECGYEDEFIVYCDCDVFFAGDPSFKGIQPRIVAAHGSRVPFRKRILGEWEHFNSGVLFINVDSMMPLVADYYDFIVQNGRGVKRPRANSFMDKNLFLSDQVALNLYFQGQIERLPEVYNWNPINGVAADAKIIHFNGLKWTQWHQFEAGSLRPDRQKKFEAIVRKNPKSYRFYVEQSLSFEEELDAN